MRGDEASVAFTKALRLYNIADKDKNLVFRCRRTWARLRQANAKIKRIADLNVLHLSEANTSIENEWIKKFEN